MSAEGDSSMVEVLVEAASKLPRSEIRRLVALFEERLSDERQDKVDALVAAIVGLKVEDMSRLRQRLNALLKVEPMAPPPPPRDGADEQGAGVRNTPKPPKLSGGAQEPMP